MNVEAKATRIVNEAGNQVLKVSGRVLSNGGFPVLPVVAESYELRLLNFSAATGEAIFEFEVEVHGAGKPADTPKTAAELSRSEQAQVFEAQQAGASTKEAIEAVVHGELAAPENN